MLLLFLLFRVLFRKHLYILDDGEEQEIVEWKLELHQLFSLKNTRLARGRGQDQLGGRSTADISSKATWSSAACSA